MRDTEYYNVYEEIKSVARMIYRNISEIELRSPNYVPIIKDKTVYYGGNQIWFSSNYKTSSDYIIHHYGCGTIATADLILYLGIKNNIYRNAVTESVLQGTDSGYYIDYMSYVRKINTYYTKTKRYIAVLGPRIALAFNSYSKTYQFGLKAKWELKLSYYDMLEHIEEMLYYDMPVILSIGPNTPNLWGKKGIALYHRDIIDQAIDITMKGNTFNQHVLYRFRPIRNNINSHYVTVTGIYRVEKTKHSSFDNKVNSKGEIMLQISSWGKLYYINYEEYRDYIDNFGGTFTSSIVYIK